MEEKKNQNSNNIAMVECPFCNKPIEAPDKADVIFTCPNCHKELITYDKVERKKETLRNERIKQEQIYKRYKKIQMGKYYSSYHKFILIHKKHKRLYI